MKLQTWYLFMNTEGNLVGWLSVTWLLILLLADQEEFVNIFIYLEGHKSHA